MTCRTPGCTGPVDVECWQECAHCYGRRRRVGLTRTHAEANRPTEPAHGTMARYRSTVWRCRCGQCRAAAAVERRRYVKAVH